MKKSVIVLAMALMAGFYTSSAVSEVMSLRGDDLTSMAQKPKKMKILSVSGGIERSFEQQPPMVPHTVDKYEVNLKHNGCMKCHSEQTYEKEKAPKVGDSHYIDRDGNVLKTLSSRRYFCNQCHTTQVGAEPLVQNNFVGAK
ncbi:MAG: nitrate reductase cytochrome c-type subunit [Gammaproteobacteria bacterium]|nr:nitrate reductase cytochrome c-type subunit [Gammaproteobacteria bacterium]